MSPIFWIVLFWFSWSVRIFCQVAPVPDLISLEGAQPVTPIVVPKAAETQTRAVELRPDVVQRLLPIDMNIVSQRLRRQPEQEFDLIIGTNIFVSYGEFEQSLALAM